MLNKRLIGLLAVILLAAGCGGGGGSDRASGGGAPAPSNSGNDNQAPVAEAGRQQNVKAGARVRLDGSASSDADSDRLDYEWAITDKPSDSGAKLEKATTATPILVTDEAGTYSVKLVVNDGSDYSDPDTVDVVATVAASNSVPVADAGEPQNVATSTQVMLDGSGSTDADNNAILSYQWRFASMPSGSAATLVDAATSTPSFTADLSGDYVVALVVSDGQSSSEPAQVTIHADEPNVAPMADAGGDRGVGIGAQVTLDASASSDADGDALGYAWQLISAPQGSGASLRNADTIKATFVADALGPYVAQVTVSDEDGEQNSDRVVVTAGPRLTLSVDMNNDGVYEQVELPYDQPAGETITHAPNPPPPAKPVNGFVLGRFEITAAGGPITLNLTFDIDVLNDATGGYSIAFDGFQSYDSGTKQVTIPEGETVAFTLNVGIPEQSLAIVTYAFKAVESGDSFEASYKVESDDF